MIAIAGPMAATFLCYALCYSYAMLALLCRSYILYETNVGTALAALQWLGRLLAANCCLREPEVLLTTSCSAPASIHLASSTVMGGRVVVTGG